MVLIGYNNGHNSNGKKNGFANGNCKNGMKKYATLILPKEDSMSEYDKQEIDLLKQDLSEKKFLIISISADIEPSINLIYQLKDNDKKIADSQSVYYMYPPRSSSSKVNLGMAIYRNKKVELISKEKLFNDHENDEFAYFLFQLTNPESTFDSELYNKVMQEKEYIRNADEAIPTAYRRGSDFYKMSLGMLISSGKNVQLNNNLRRSLRSMNDLRGLERVLLNLDGTRIN